MWCRGWVTASQVPALCTTPACLAGMELTCAASLLLQHAHATLPHHTAAAHCFCCWHRFVPSLRGEGVDVVIGVFKALCILGGENETGLAAEGVLRGAWLGHTSSV